MKMRGHRLLPSALAIFFSITAPMVWAAERLQDQSKSHREPHGTRESPQAVFSEVLYDAGTVEAGVDIIHTFRVKNVGKADLLIERVNPG